MSLKCTPYEVMEYEEGFVPCQCPVCGGFLAWSEVDNTPICNKCETELILLPEVDEETGEEMEWGKICPISERKKS